MIPQAAKDKLKELNLTYAPVAVKFCFNKPAGYDYYDMTGTPMCKMIKLAQDMGKAFYVEVAQEGCMAKFDLGAADMESFSMSGNVGFLHGIYRQQGGNACMYYGLDFLRRGTVNYMIFAPATEADFDPDLMIFVAPVDEADYIMRASHFVTGDFYESKSTPVLGCHWLFNYPYTSGKINNVITGMHMGMKRQKCYPAGLYIISIPFQQLQNFYVGLAEMEHDILALTVDDDPEAKAIVDNYYEVMGKMHSSDFATNPSDRLRG